MKLLKTLSLLTVLLAPQPWLAEERQTFVISHFDHPHMETLKAVLVKAYDELDIDLEFREVTSERSIKMLDDGLVDGEVIRNKLLYNPNGNALMSYQMTRPTMELFCEPGIACNEGVLSDPEAVIGAYQIHKYYLEQYYGDKIKAELVEIASVEQMATLIQKKHFKYVTMAVLRRAKLPAKFDAFEKHVLFSLEGVHMVHKRHKALLPEINKAIQRQLSAYPDLAL